MIRDIEFVFLLFAIYSIIGWVVETVHCWILTKKFVNRGFLIGPYCPIYGIGCTCIVVLLKKYMNDPLVLFVLASVICSLDEYIISFIMEKMFKNRWWDYSDKKFNINGRICLENSILFGILAFLIMYTINPPIENYLNTFSDELINIVSIALFSVMFVDFIVTMNVMNKIKKIAFEAKRDNTAEITTRVREIIGASSSILLKHITNAFPNFRSTLKSKRQELEEKRQEVINLLKDNIDVKKLSKKISDIRYKVKVDNSEK